MRKIVNNDVRRRNLCLILIIVLITLIDLVLLLNAGKERYSVVFLDGEEIYPVIVKENELVEKRKNEKDNFIGWYLNDNLYDFSREVKSDLILKAKYEEIIMHKVTFDTDGGNEISPVMVKEGKTLLEVEEPTKENYVFKGWLNGEEKYNFNSPVVTDLNLKAWWEEVSETEKIYTLSFDTDGGSEVAPQKIKNGEYPIKPQNPTKEGYNFKDWYLNGKVFSWNFALKANTTIKAVWVAKPVVKVTFNSSGGSTISPINVYKGETAELSEPTKAGYVFAGWYYRNALYTSATKINSSVTLTAKWVTTDEANATQAIKAIKSSYEILNGGTKIKVTYAGCVITNTNSEILDEITRELSDKTLTLKFSIECGSVKKTATSKAVIKASTYGYQIKDSKLKIVGTNFDGELFKLDGTKIAYVLSGVAEVESDISENLILVLHDDSKTKYVIKKIVD